MVNTFKYRFFEMDLRGGTKAYFEMIAKSKEPVPTETNRRRNRIIYEFDETDRGRVDLEIKQMGLVLEEVFHPYHIVSFRSL
ncbi:hypothetical protein SAMN04488109_1835 [Chryseolinea serpens]|uniref:Uncharacterized protein n=1 Tax=Chryseolinea serpens TaxID=947013 RepID=A0A1M5MNF9_9BACT|nr:hypothetical protein [Chryseolinea serpens]SHG78776.1 hypothetical protein SAMN04488109_1835 [Chryseolinea serpens]